MSACRSRKRQRLADLILRNGNVPRSVQDNDETSLGQLSNVLRKRQDSLPITVQSSVPATPSIADVAPTSTAAISQPIPPDTPDTPESSPINATFSDIIIVNATATATATATVSEDPGKTPLLREH